MPIVSWYTQDVSRSPSAILLLCPVRVLLLEKEPAILSILHSVLALNVKYPGL